MELQSLIWLHDGIWVLPRPSDEILKKVVEKVFEDHPNPEALIRAAPVLQHVQNCERLNRIYNQINGIVRPAHTWTDIIKQDALNRRTGSKKVRDLALANRKVNLPRGDQKQDTLIKFFLKKKGIV